MGVEVEVRMSVRIALGTLPRPGATRSRGEAGRCAAGAAAGVEEAQLMARPMRRGALPVALMLAMLAGGTAAAKLVVDEELMELDGPAAVQQTWCAASPPWVTA